MDFQFPDEHKRGPGRPLGTPNKTFMQKVITETFTDLYKDIEPTLTPDEKRYFKEAFNGKIAFDPLQDGMLFVKLLSVLTVTQTTKALHNGTITKELAELINQYRQMLKDMEDISRKRIEAKEKKGELGDMVDPTRESALGRVESILGGNSRK